MNSEVIDIYKKQADAHRKRIAELEERIAESSRRIKNGLAWIDDYGDDFEMAKDDIRAGYEILKGGADAQKTVDDMVGMESDMNKIQGLGKRG